MTASSESPPAAPFLAARPLLQGRSSAAAVFAFLLFTLIAFSVALVPIRADNDCWWHVKSGQVIAEQGLPTYDVFSFTAADHEWHNHEWLTQLAMWRIWQAGEWSGLGGWRAVILAVAVCIWLAYALVFLLVGRLGKNWWLALLIAIVALDLGRRTFYPRPPVVSNVLLAGQMLLLVGIYERWWSKRWLLVIPPLYVLWSNLHGAWMAGAVVLCAFAAQDLLADGIQRVVSWRRSKRDGGSSEEPFALPLLWGRERVPSAWWLTLAPVTVLATFANPSGWRLYELPGRVMNEPLLVSLIGELLPPRWMFYPLSVTFLICLFALILVIAARAAITRRLVDGFHLPLAETMIFAFFLYQGANHVRHLMLLSLVMAPFVVRWIAVAGPSLIRGEGVRFAGLPVCLLAATLLLSSWPERQSYPARNHQYLQIREGYIAPNFPAAPADFIEFAELEGRMFNRNSYAGYLIWRFSPEQHLLFSDSRFDIFGASILTQELIVTDAFEPQEEEDFPSWREVLDKWEIQWMLVQAGDGIARHLAEEPRGWILVADWTPFAPASPPWQIWVRESEENVEMIDRAQRRFRGANWNPFRISR